MLLASGVSSSKLIHFCVFLTILHEILSMLYRSIKILFISLHILSTCWKFLWSTGSTMTLYRSDLCVNFFLLISLPLILHVSPTKRSHHQSPLGLAFLMNLRQLISAAISQTANTTQPPSSRAIYCKSSTNRVPSFVRRNGLVIL